MADDAGAARSPGEVPRAEGVWRGHRRIGRRSAVEGQVRRPWPRTGSGGPNALVADAVDVGSLRVTAVSLRGPKNTDTSHPRQDAYDFGLARTTDRVVVAIADGVSAARHSDVGAAVAARTAVDQVLGMVDRSRDPGTSDVDWHHLAGAVSTALRWRAGSMGGVPPGLLATTLDVAIVGPVSADGDSPFTRARIVGDSTAVVDDVRGIRVLGGAAHAGGVIADRGVSVLPSDVVPVPVVESGVLPRGSGLSLVTDGLGDVLGDGMRPGVELFVRGWTRAESLLELVDGSSFVAAGAIDDRTAVTVWNRDTTGATG
ncbi:protein phosphatase 2C domain-containing protein [Dietzia sp. SL131]|uniref:protein phosphatase 2C domain-containing protein n=1 Tax=Dietzia sp. SL131 TaxID=2995149 RepID=UPI00227CA079|nr:protein phosphatase 2C domain-containing protein [Dietzia sp. SL131]MCY1658248.1 protein phosphatase 2C domain-containing protein [Dietzia sp. SL131]